MTKREDLCVMGVSDASYNQEDHLVIGTLIILDVRKGKVFTNILENKTDG